jgi:hypothetical protein
LLRIRQRRHCPLAIRPWWPTQCSISSALALTVSVKNQPGRIPSSDTMGGRLKVYVEGERARARRTQIALKSRRGPGTCTMKA